MEEKKYPIGGFAPGNYQCNCCKCGTFFIGDKRAVECEPCALTAKEKFDALSPEEQAEVIKRNVEAVNELFKDWGKKPDVNLAIMGHGKPELNHDRVISNQVAGMPLEEAIFQDGYSAGHDAGYEKGRREAKSGPVWVSGAPKENKQYFAKVPGIIEDDTVYNAVIWPIEGSEHWWCIGYGFRFSIHREKIIAHIDESPAAGREGDLK